MFLRPFDLFSEYGVPSKSLDAVRRLQHEMNRWIDDGGSTRSAFPAVRFYRDGDTLLMQAWIAGLDPQSLHVTVEGNELTVKGTIAIPLAAGSAVVRQEIPQGEFERSFQLPYRVADEQIQASYKNGVLTIEMPRAASDKPRKIEVSMG